MDETLIRVDQLSYQYSDGGEALHDVLFTIHAGEKVGLIGPNGAGKIDAAASEWRAARNRAGHSRRVASQ